MKTRTRKFWMMLGVATLVLTCASGEARAADGGLLVIKRSPRLGNVLVVDLQIDGKPAGTLSWGGTYRKSLVPGHHVISVLAIPKPQNPNRWEMGLDVQAGKTYTFTAQSGPKRQLVLARG